jgi:hypothetical protein
VWHHDAVLLTLWVPVGVALIAPAVALPLAAGLARSGARRGALVISVVLIVLTVIASQRANIALQPLRRELAFASAWSHRECRADRPLWVSRDTYRARLDQLLAGERGVHTPSRSPRVFVSNRGAAVAFTCITFALAGVTFARRSRLALIVLAGIVSLAHVATAFLFTRMLYVQAVTGWNSAIWAPVLLVFLVVAWIAVQATEPAQ